MTNLIAEWIADAMLPFNTVSNPRFRAFVEYADPQYDLRSEKYFRTVVFPNMHRLVKTKIQDIVERDIVAFTGTTDMWSSQSRQSYISLTIHFIDSQWKRKMAVLACQGFSGNLLV